MLTPTTILPTVSMGRKVSTAYACISCYEGH